MVIREKLATHKQGTQEEEWWERKRWSSRNKCGVGLWMCIYRRLESGMSEINEEKRETEETMEIVYYVYNKVNKKY